MQNVSVFACPGPCQGHDSRSTGVSKGTKQMGNRMKELQVNNVYCLSANFDKGQLASVLSGHVAAPCDGLPQRPYINCVPVASRAQTVGSPLRVGDDRITGEYFNALGASAQLQSHSRALRPSEIPTDVNFPPVGG